MLRSKCSKVIGKSRARCAHVSGHEVFVQLQNSIDSSIVLIASKGESGDKERHY